ncbi:hypothetical protein COW53_04255 [bacterium CG17_big_fil_post_rev_8_21_14_2_50_64_8]|nr:MAG: hypothetical protein COW53_04255 [bacterium CG17_big_fil_post_rev_8_21_14_2_50_64_8]PJA73189.1 MAG: hypothetical protein CO151_14465 [bacterium CG_4_9_14_3_um_filter_65_15]
MPRPLISIGLVLVALTLVPIGCIYRARHSVKGQPRIQVVYDMDNQYYYKAQSADDFFADGRSMRTPVDGTVARGDLRAGDPFFRGRVEGDTTFVTEFPVTVDQDLMHRGQERFQIFCAPCHGLSGNGNGVVNIRATALAEGTWTPPSDLVGQSVVDRPVGHIYNTITHGIRNMPSYKNQIDPRDRWAIVAYVRALQLSRNASLADVPADDRAALENLGTR